MKDLIVPHGGGALSPRLLEGEARAELLGRVDEMPRVRISTREAGDLVMLGIGGFTPLEGFMSRADWQGVCDDMRTASGLFWPIPITLSTDADTAAGLREGDEVALCAPTGDTVLGTLSLQEQYGIDREHECREVFRTTDPAHPGVQVVMAQGAVNLAGPVRVLDLAGFDSTYPELFLTPAQTRDRFRRLGWCSVAAFQTRNPMHRSHEYLAKIGIEVCDGVLVHSLLGNLKPGDIPAEVRSRTIDALLAGYFVDGTALHAGYPLDMRYAGPREALLHALFRQNYGCTHQIIGRDHAGVGDYYGPFDSHHIFDEIPADALEIEPLKIDWTFWCEACQAVASMRTCPHEGDDRLLLSGTKLRKMLSEGDDVPEHFSRPEVLTILRAYYESLGDDEKVDIVLSGHSAR